MPPSEPAPPSVVPALAGRSLVWLVLAIMALDVASKAWVQTQFLPTTSMDLWGTGGLMLRPVLNTTQWLAFIDLPESWFTGRHLVGVATAPIIVWMVLSNKWPPVQQWGLGFVLGGSLAAIFTFPLTGWATLDFLVWDYGPRWLAFNVADLALLIGATVCFLHIGYILFRGSKPPPTPQESTGSF